MQYRVENNVPLPTNAKRGGSKYPFADMKVNDSFWAPIKNPKSLASVAYTWGRAHGPAGCKFVARQEGNGSRIWRLK